MLINRVHSFLTLAASACADQVYVEMKRKARDAVLSMVEREREGEQIDRVGIVVALLSHLLRCSEISYYGTVRKT